MIPNRRTRQLHEAPPAPGDLFIVPDQSAPRTGRPLPERRLSLLMVAVYSVFLLLLLQSLRLQVASGFLFRSRAEGNRIREFTEYAPRGIFLDRRGSPLVQNVPAMELSAEPTALPKNLEVLVEPLRAALPGRDLGALTARLATLRGAPGDGQSGSDGSPVTLLQNLTYREFLALAARADLLPGLRAETAPTRAYRGNGPFAHVLGYTGNISPEERETYPRYLLTETVGKSGLERAYERYLRGRHGARRAEVDALGAVQHDLGREPPTAGMNLRLHLDAGLQERAAQALERGLKTAGVGRGAVVALDPFSGAVRALVSAPTFPHSDLARGLDEDTARVLLNRPDSPLLNRVIQGEYVPGSTFKLIVAAGALEERVATPETAVDSRGGIQVNQWFFPDWKSGGHGRTNLRKALAESVNTYFYSIGGGMGQTPGLGIERMTAWASRLGAGAPTGIDLPGEQAGFLPSPAWKEQTKRESWYIGDTYHAAIGQGDVLITPLQLAVATAAIANGGTVYAPRVLDAVEGPTGEIIERVPPAVRAERVIAPDTASATREGMRAAVTEGSAQGLAALQVPAAAKTGTAQVGGTERIGLGGAEPRRTHAWVTAFAPVEKPELVLVVLLEEAGGGDRVAVPVAAEILAWYFSSENRSARALFEGSARL